MSLDNDQKKKLYRLLYLGRRFEERLGELFTSNEIEGWVHLGIGQEGTGAALSLCYEEGDYLVPYHRSRISMLGKGLEPKSLLAEIMGKKTGCCNGVGGEAHIMDVESGIYGTGGIIAGNIPIAVGLAYASKLEGENRVVVCGFGDGGSNRGAFHESLNMAAIFELPIVFICENNQFAEFTATKDTMKIENIADRSAAFGMPGVIIDGSDPEKCVGAIQKAMNDARNGKGPTLIESKTFRVHGHYEGDPMRYVDGEETKKWLEKDPFITYRKQLLDGAFAAEDELAAIEEDVEKDLEDAVQFALESERPTAEEVVENIYA